MGRHWSKLILTNEGNEPIRGSVGWVMPSQSYERKSEHLACRRYWRMHIRWYWEVCTVYAVLTEVISGYTLLHTCVYSALLHCFKGWKASKVFPLYLPAPKVSHIPSSCNSFSSVILILQLNLDIPILWRIFLLYSSMTLFLLRRNIYPELQLWLSWNRKSTPVRAQNILSETFDRRLWNTPVRRWQSLLGSSCPPESPRWLDIWGSSHLHRVCAGFLAPSMQFCRNPVRRASIARCERLFAGFVVFHSLTMKSNFSCLNKDDLRRTQQVAWTAVDLVLHLQKLKKKDVYIINVYNSSLTKPLFLSGFCISLLCLITTHI